MDASIHRYCSTCGADNPSQASLSCFACGQPLQVASTAPLLQPVAVGSSHNGGPLAASAMLRQHYHILDCVGTGGFGAVYKAEDTKVDNRLVAVKGISLGGLRPHEIIEATESFNREITLLSGLQHPNLPRVYDHFSDAECWYIVMDYIEGKTLEEYLNSSGAPQSQGMAPAQHFTLEEVLEIGIQLCTVLDYLHTRQPMIVFRDLKPANIMLTPKGHLYLIDFGIARRFKPGQDKDTIPFGSPGYAAPEQYGRTQTTSRADIYSLGATLHHLLTGRDPSLAPFRFAPLQWQDSALLAGLEKLLIQMVEVDASKRPESMDIIKQELQRIAAEWNNRERSGLQPRVLQSHQPTQPAGNPDVSHHPQPSSLPPQPQATIAFVGKGGQVMHMHQPAASRLFTAPTGTSAPPVPQKLNWIAMIAMIFALANFFLPILFYRFEAEFARPPFYGMYFFIPLAIVPLLTIVFAHIGRNRARRDPSLKASENLASLAFSIGSIFALIYISFVLLFLCALVSTGWLVV